MKNVALSTVYLIKNNNSYDEKPRSGKPKEYSDEMFIQLYTKYPTKSTKEHHDIWKKDDRKNSPSLSTIENGIENIEIAAKAPQTNAELE
eukprot:gene11113-3932_t